MGYLTHMMVAPEARARSFADQGTRASSSGQVVDLTGVDDFQLAKLWCILRQDDSDYALHASIEALAKDYWEGADALEGASVVALPGDLVEVLRLINEDDVPSISAAWLRCYAELLIPVSQEEVANYLRVLQSLAQEAAQKHERVLMRMGE